MAAFAQLFSLMVGAIVMPLATILLIVAETWSGRLFANVRALRAAGAEVTFEPMENADHFLIFVEREKALAKLERGLSPRGDGRDIFLALRGAFSSRAPKSAFSGQTLSDGYWESDDARSF